jgi:hypothetical protein
MTTAFRQVRASYTDQTITVYQAYSAVIADEALRLGRFGPSFSRNRMTWIKPSFRWMMYRSGFATKPGQERVLAIRISRAGFEWALRHAGLSHYDPAVHADHQAWQATRDLPVRVQWDPERDLHTNPLDHRSIQIGLSGPAVARYVDEWITDVTDVTDLAHSVAALVADGRLADAADLVPDERPYPLPPDVATLLGATSTVVPEAVTVLRGDLPCPGVRVGRVAAYEFDIPEGHYVRPGAGRRQRSFLLLDESAQLNQPVVFRPHHAGWWYVDLVDIREDGATIHVVDHYVDFVVGPAGLPYRVLDLHELGEALTTGALTTDQVAHVLAATQAFADRHLQGRDHEGPDWPDFPPAALAPVRDLDIPAH